LVAPPTFPTVVRPRPANRTKHIASQNPRALAAHRRGSKVVVDTCLTGSVAVHVDKRLCRKKPFHQLRPANPERIFKRLIRPGRIAIQRNTNTLNYDFRHAGNWDWDWLGTR